MRQHKTRRNIRFISFPVLLRLNFSPDIAPIDVPQRRIYLDIVASRFPRRYLSNRPTRRTPRPQLHAYLISALATEYFPIINGPPLLRACFPIPLPPTLSDSAIPSRLTLDVLARIIVPNDAMIVVKTKMRKVSCLSRKVDRHPAIPFQIKFSPHMR